MSTDTTTAAESALLAARHRLHALGVPADDIPDDLLAVAVGGSLMPSLPGWTPARARDWTAVAVRWPAVARRVVAWCEASAGRLANLEAVTVRPEHGGLVEMRRTDNPDIYANRGMLNLDGSGHWGRAAEAVLERVLVSLNRIPRPWHAELTAAVAAARRGEVEGGPERIVVDGGRSTRAAPAYRLRAITRLRILDDAVATHLMGHVHRVNTGPFCGAGPGELLLDGMQTDNIGVDARRQIRLSYDFRFRPGARWDRFLDSDGAWREMIDHRGRSMFEPADFYELP